VFDLKKLEWLNAVYVSKLLDADKLKYVENRMVRFLTSRGYLTAEEAGRARNFLDRIVVIAIESVKHGEPSDLAGLIFEYDASAIAAGEKTSAVVKDPVSRQILGSFITKVLAEPELKFERFQEIMKSVEKETGKKGRDLFHPVRVALTGSDSGPELKKLIPIFEEGSKLPLARHVKGAAERLREFAAAANLECSEQRTVNNGQ
jgi:glutamyl-tRNA synthetase/nondiscriminating glutamyl-tRNA synthetase